MEEDIKKEIREELKMYHLTEEDLTSDELKALEDEIKAKRKGYMILDGVLTGIDIYRRALKKRRK